MSARNRKNRKSKLQRKRRIRKAKHVEQRRRELKAHLEQRRATKKNQLWKAQMADPAKMVVHYRTQAFEALHYLTAVAMSIDPASRDASEAIRSLLQHDAMQFIAQ